MKTLACTWTLIVAVALGGSAAAASPDTAEDPGGHWEGAIELPSLELTVMVDLEQGEDGAWRGTIDIPQQGAEGLPLEAITAAADSLTFAIEGIPGTPTFRGTVAGTEVRGTFTQGGQTFPFRLGREAMPKPARPQEPEPPYPYTVEEVGYESSDVHLAATLTIPEGDGPFPAAVLLTGSGAQDRDEELFGHKFFLVLADHLTRQGIAVLRADDRGVGGSTGSTMQSTTSDFADDALAGIRFLRTRDEIAPDRIGLVGHSEGGIVAPLAAARDPEAVAFVVMLAGTGVPLGDVIVHQVELMTQVAGADSATVAQESAKSRLLVELALAGADGTTLSDRFTALLREQAAALPDSARPTDEEIASTAKAAVAGFDTPWMRYALSLDPREALREVTCPVLVINGDLDRQVDPDQNLPEIEAALADNPDVTVKRLPGLNHLLQTAQTGLPAEYGAIEETMSPLALETVSAWILERFAAR